MPDDLRAMLRDALALTDFDVLRHRRDDGNVGDLWALVGIDVPGAARPAVHPLDPAPAARREPISSR